jgi:hypothetical protein
MRKRGAIDPVARIKTKVGEILTPEQIAASGSEHAHQCAVMQWLALHGKAWAYLNLLYAIPNGGDRTQWVGAAMKAEGVKVGVPDLCLPVPAGGYPGLYVEMKVPSKVSAKDGGRSPKQVQWCQDLRQQKYAVVLAFGWQAAVDALILYHRGRLSMPEDGDALFMVPRENVTMVA